MAFNAKYQKIIFCDSIKGSKIFEKIHPNIDLLASYFFPSIKAVEWTTEQVIEQYRFQTNRNDCGFHLVNFLSAAVDDRRIIDDEIVFEKNKASFATEIKEHGIATENEKIKKQRRLKTSSKKN